jgi:hypothetical protein
MKTAFIVAVLCTLVSSRLLAYTTVTISTAAPAGFEEEFLAATTSQFLGKVVKNPLASHTYSLILYGENPAYNPPPTNADLLNALVTTSTSTYLYGFAAGMVYQNDTAINYTASMYQLCPSATNFTLVQTSTETFDRWSCMDSLNTLLDEFYEIELSTPTVLPGF